MFRVLFCAVFLFINLSSVAGQQTNLTAEERLEGFLKAMGGL